MWLLSSPASEKVSRELSFAQRRDAKRKHAQEVVQAPRAKHGEQPLLRSDGHDVVCTVHAAHVADRGRIRDARVHVW